jgi:hypothetical protein
MAITGAQINRALLRVDIAGEMSNQELARAKGPQIANLVALANADTSRAANNAMDAAVKGIFNARGGVLSGVDRERGEEIIKNVLKAVGAEDQLRMLAGRGIEELGGDHNTAEAQRRALENVSSMLNYGSESGRALEREGLKAHRRVWSDSSRYEGSSWGDAIADVWATVKQRDARFGREATVDLPIIKENNFEDPISRIEPKNIKVRLDNVGGRRREATLEELLKKPYLAMKDPNEWPGYREGNPMSLLADGTDFTAKVGVQHTIVPVAGGATTEFIPNINTYGTREVIFMITQEGVSLHYHDGNGNLKLMHNANGDAAPLKVQRLSDSNVDGGTASTGGDAQHDARMADRVILVQVPLETPRRMRGDFLGGPAVLSFGGGLESLGATRGVMRGGAASLGMEDGVVTHGRTVGEFDHGAIPRNAKRDQDKAVRIDIMLTKASDDGNVTNGLARVLKAQMNAARHDALWHGSEVVPE